MNTPEINIDINLDIDIGGPEIPADVENDARNQLSETHAIAKAKRHEYENRMKFEGDMDYYFTIVFKSKAERDAWLSMKGISNFDNKPYMFYDDIAEKL